MPLPEEFLQNLKARNDIESVVSSYVNLRRRGRTLVGLCPFHGEKTPSFTVYPESESFYCFGCGAGGDAITFIRRIENLDYLEAVKFLAQRAGIEMPATTRADDGLSRLRMRVLEANRAAARFYHQCLLSPQGERGLAYLRGRALSDATITHFGLGFAPEEWGTLCAHLKNAGFTQQELLAAGLASQGRNGGVYDRFRNRVMFPIIDLRGNVIGFGGRVLEKAEPKYLNTAETLVFDKGSGLFALNFAKNVGAESIILAEGYMDVISLHQAGFQNAVATLGTALTPQQALLLSRYTGEIILCYDADAAGQKATARAIPLLKKAGLRVRVLTIPEAKDPDEYIKAKGPERFQQLIARSGNEMEYRLSKLREQNNPATPEGRVRFLNAAVDLLAGGDNPIENDVYAGRLAAECKVEKATLLHQIELKRKKIGQKARQEEAKQVQRSLSAARDPVNPERARRLRAALAEEALIAYLSRNPDRIGEVAKTLPPERFSTSFNKGVYEKLIQVWGEGHAVDISAFSEYYSVEEMGRIAQILNQNAQEKNTRDAERDYIGVILSEYEKPTLEQAAAGSEQDILEYLSNLRRQKK